MKHMRRVWVRVNSRGEEIPGTGFKSGCAGRETEFCDLARVLSKSKPAIRGGFTPDAQASGLRITTLRPMWLIFG